ncbi:MAG TPA: GxxExxY protein [Candidatus Didemnitutus sp.]|nr:GxxExxY protein [Candidatus Didemnitutus sp.]
MAFTNQPFSLTPEDLANEIIDAATAVLNELGPGLEDKLYERAIVIELRKRGHKVDQQRPFPVYYSGELIGSMVPDIIVNDLVVTDPMVVESFNETHVRHMLGYLTITKFKLALLLNFKHYKLESKRVVRDPVER